VQRLISGLHHFQSSVFAPQRELFERLLDGQRPDALFITCSDSRVAPNLITHTPPGTLFILRNAGNIVPAWGAPTNGEAATIEFALTALDIRDIIICGHTHCGAAKAILDEKYVAGMPTMARWLEHSAKTRRIMSESYRELPEDARLVACIEENVLVQLENLRTHPLVAERIADGRLSLHAWVYALESGQVHAYDADAGQYVPVSDAQRGPHDPPEQLVGPKRAI
jgi:carbonic anhydrase